MAEVKVNPSDAGSGNPSAKDAIKKAAGAFVKTVSSGAKDAAASANSVAEAAKKKLSGQK